MEDIDGGLHPAVDGQSLDDDDKLSSSLCMYTFYQTDSKDYDDHVLDWWMPARKTHPACNSYEDRM